MDGGSWQATVLGVTKSRTRLSDKHKQVFHYCIILFRKLGIDSQMLYKGTLLQPLKLYHLLPSCPLFGALSLFLALSPSCKAADL